MFISKFCKLGVHTIKSASTGTAPTLTSRFSNFPQADNHHLIFLRQKLFSSTADEVGDEEKKKINVIICNKVGKETWGRSGVVLDEGEIGKETWGRSGVVLDEGEIGKETRGTIGVLLYEGAYGRPLSCSACHDIVMAMRLVFFSSKLGDEEKKKIFRSGVIKIWRKFGKETCIEGRAGVVLDEGEIGKETWGTSDVALDEGACGRSLAWSPCHDIVMAMRLKLSSSKLGDEEKKKKVRKETCIEGRSGVVLDKGACGRSLACSTSHDIVMDPEQYNKLPEPADEENDMLDSAFGVTETSHFAVDGHKPKPH